MTDRTLAKALAVAAEAHADQVDKVGAPYAAHVLAVTAGVLRDGHPDWVAAAAALHDVIEDTALDAAALADLGFPPETVEIVAAVTRPKGEAYADYLARVAAAGPEARAVKLSDALDNLSRAAAHPDRGEASRLAAKYRRAVAFLAAYESPA